MLLHTIKENIEKKMKKTYFSPEIEVVKMTLAKPLLLGSGEKEDITDGPVPEVPDLPGDDDGEW